MKPKKVAMIFLLTLVICVIIIISIVFYLIILQNNNQNQSNTNTSNNFTEENFIDYSNVTLSEEYLARHPEIDLNVMGIDWSYDDDSNDMIIEENSIENQKEQEITQEMLDNFNFSISYENIPEEISGYINNAFDNFDEKLKEFVYKNGYAAANKATYNDYRTANSGRTVIINFVLNDYYASSIGILINLDDYSFEFFENQ